MCATQNQNNNINSSIIRRTLSTESDLSQINLNSNNHHHKHRTSHWVEQDPEDQTYLQNLESLESLNNSDNDELYANIGPSNLYDGFYNLTNPVLLDDSENMSYQFTGLNGKLRWLKKKVKDTKLVRKIKASVQESKENSNNKKKSRIGSSSTYNDDESVDQGIEE